MFGNKISEGNQKAGKNTSHTVNLVVEAVDEKKVAIQQTCQASDSYINTTM